MKKGIFITGTDTGIGKTHVAEGLIRAFREMGLDVCPMKPVETGCTVKKDTLVPQDTTILMAAAGVHEPVDLINPYRFKFPLAPAVAAECEGVVIRKKKIISSCLHLLKKYDLIVVEGAGGIMVPVYKNYLFLDLIQDLDFPLVIVARPGLGTINHTLLTIQAAQSRKIRTLGVIMNYTGRNKKDLSEKTNPKTIKRLSGVPVLGIIPYAKNKKPDIRIFRFIAGSLKRNSIRMKG
jgi:dethiobiotin synthetase